MVTILDVAEEAGVSAATVSRVINNNPNISKATTKKVWLAAEKLGYEPNMLARSFRKKETRIILVLVPNITNPYYAHILSGISDTTRALGYSSFICNTQGDREQEKEVLDMLARRRADGAILLATELGAGWLKKYIEKYPIIQCSEYDPEVPIPHVCIDNYKAARDVVHYLLELGHTQIGTISSNNNYISTQLRLQGYNDELVEAGIQRKSEYIYYASIDYSFESGRIGAQTLLAQKNPPTAIYCVSDVLAQGAIEGAKEMGLSVPEDVTIVGFDDVEQTTRYHPHLTTTAQPCSLIGKKATELLVDCIAGQDLEKFRNENLEFILPHKLVVRESSAPPAE